MKIYYTHAFNKKMESHRLLEQAIGRYLDKDSGGLISGLKTGELGKPYIEGFDGFSISHSERSWAVLFDSSECGLDIQYHKKLDYMPIAERWFHKDEVRRISELKKKSDEEGLNEFFRIWTRREALVKAMGRSIVDSGLASTLPDSVNIEGSFWHIIDLEVPETENVSAAVCVSSPDEVEWINLSEE